jgi:hypothetical protein
MKITTYDEYRNQGRHVAEFRAGVNIADIKKWCWQTYGNTGDRWQDNIHFGEVVFSNKADLEWFLLRWS